MSERDDSGPAFPAEWDYIGSNREVANGMSLRDYFAVEALPVVAPASHVIGTDYLERERYAIAAADAYRMADAMLKARNA